MKVSQWNEFGKTSVVLGVCFASALISSCGTKTASTAIAVEDTSTSGVAAATVTGALSTSASGGTLAKFDEMHLLDFLIPKAYAGTACPTLLKGGAACYASGSDLWLSYNTCTFGVSTATWTGVQLLHVSSGTLACDSKPVVGPTTTATRQFVAATGYSTPGSMVRVSASGVTHTMDNATANLGNFDTAIIPAVLNGGYGTTVGFNASGLRSTVSIAQRVYSKTFDHSVYTATPLQITEASATALSRKVSGTITVYHNKLMVVGNSVMTDILHTVGCCQPAGGTIVTTYTAGANVAPTTAGAKLVGKSETLAFTSCGVGTLTDASGTVSNVVLTHCF